MWRLCLAISIRVIALVIGHPKIAGTVVALIATTATGAWLLVPRTYSTEAGEWRSVTLNDGTVARLGPRTKIVLRYDRLRRSIQQLGGEAIYQVAHDANRPFSVKCGMATVQAIGTKFAVRCDAENINVVVAEGTVAVSRGLVRPDQVPSADYVRLEAGHGVQFDQWTPLLPKPVDLDVALAWERGRIKFEGTPIEQAIAEYNRRHKQQIPIPRVYDPNFVVIGEYDLENPEKFIRDMKTSPALQPPPKSQ